MSFGSSLGYPFKSGNIPKILSIILSFLVIVASIVVIAMLFQSSDIATGIVFTAIPVILGYALFVSGYSITVIRSVMDGEEFLPAANIGRDIGRGFMCLLAGFVYAIPFIVVYACIFMVAGASIGAMTNGARYGSSGGDGGAMMMICGAGILMIVMGFTIGFSYIVGMVRYAAEDTASALFNFGQNFSTVTSNFGTVFGLFFRQLGLGIIYGILTQIISFGSQGFIVNSMNDRSPNIPLLIAGFIAIYTVILSLSLMNQLSSAHLFANFGNEIGITSQKAKHDDYSNY
jgi:hypothetical protein